MYPKKAVHIIFFVHETILTIIPSIYNWFNYLPQLSICMYIFSLSLVLFSAFADITRECRRQFIVRLLSWGYCMRSITPYIHIPCTSTPVMCVGTALARSQSYNQRQLKATLLIYYYRGLHGSLQKPWMSQSHYLRRP